MAKQKNAEAPVKYVGYPLNTLEAALRFGKAVKDCGGVSGPVPKSVIAAALKMADASPGFYSQVANAKTFGVVTGSTDLELTSAAKDYFHPTSDTAKRHAELEFFRSPGIFKILIARFDGNVLPSNEILTNLLLQQKNVPPSWAGRITATFRSAAELLGILQSNYLRFDVAKHIAAGSQQSRDAEIDDSDDVSDDSSTSTSSSSSSISTGNEPRFGDNGDASSRRVIQLRRAQVPIFDMPQDEKDVWVFDGGKIRLETQSPLTRPVWEKLKKYVELLEPEKPTQ